MVKKRFSLVLVLCMCVLFVSQVGLAQVSKTLFTEDFEGLDLGPFVDETFSGLDPLDNTKVWTQDGPEGWVNEIDLLPADGVLDWRGWSWANKDAWAFVAGDQRRTEFTKGEGTVMIADSDEWDDLPHGEGSFNAIITTAPISIAGAAENSLVLKLDSSWRPEGSQTAILTVNYSNGASEDAIFWTSADGDAFYHDHLPNETVSVQLSNPAGADSLTMEFDVLDASNNWWWAVDNIEISSGGNVLYAEDFEELELGPFNNENLPDNIESLDSSKVWTNVPPSGWTIDNSGVAGFDEQAGVTDWRGWTFANVSAWATIAGDQRRFEFTKANNTVAIADPDEWDDIGSPSSIGTFNSGLISPPISLEGVFPDSVIVTFDSSWRPEDTQAAALTAIFDNGDSEEIFFWDSTEGSDFFKDDNSTNDTLTFPVPNPEGASSFQLNFEMLNATNDWWWAIDNIRVVGTVEGQVAGPMPLPFSEDFEGLVLGSSVDEEVPADNVWTKTAPPGWEIDDSGVPSIGVPGEGVTEWEGWSFANKDWWAETAGDQRRSEFAAGMGTVAIVDPDEWDDIGDPESLGGYTSFLSTPPLLLGEAAPNTVVLDYDSSYRQEEPTQVVVKVTYDGSNPVEVLHWTWVTTDPNFHEDAPSEHITLPLNNPAGASTMVVTWGILEAQNDWWWAIDNISISAGTAVENWQLF